jgi:hypothetical protein
MGRQFMRQICELLAFAQRPKGKSRGGQSNTMREKALDSAQEWEEELKKSWEIDENQTGDGVGEQRPLAKGTERERQVVFWLAIWLMY